MMEKSLLLILVCFSVWNVWCALARDLPEYFPRCLRLNPNFEKCMIDASKTVKPFLIKGIPELKMPPIEPFVVPEVMLEQGSQVLNFKSILTNVAVDGLSNYTFHDMDIDFDKLQAQVKGSWDDVHLRGDYVVQGKVLVVPIKSTGKFTAYFTRGFAKYMAQITVTKKKGREYYSLVDSKMDFTVENPQLKLNGEFEGGEEFSQAVKKVVDENIDLLFDDMKPVFETLLSNIFETIIFNNLAGKIPVDSLFGPSSA